MYKTKANEVVKRLASVLPKDWRKIALSVEIDDSYYRVFYYAFIGDETVPIQCYQLIGKYAITKEMLSAAFRDVYNIMKSLWVDMGKSGQQFYHYTLIFDSDLNFNEYFDYTPLDQCSPEYDIEWAKKYLS